MSNPCYYHPDTQARSACVQCGVPICEACTDRINERTVCHRCVKAVRERMEKQMAASPMAASPTAGSSGYAPGGYGAPAPGAGAWPPAPAPQTYRSSAPTADAPDLSKLIIGIVVASLIGIVGAIIVEKIYFYAGFGLSLLYILIGYGIGYGLYAVTKRGGMGMACLAVGIMVVSLLVGQLVLTSDVLNKVRDGATDAGGLTTAALFPLLITKMGFMHWVCIAFGLYSCFKGVARQG